MSLDKIVVILVFIGFCIGGFYLANKANQEMNKKAIKDNVNGNDQN